MKAMNNEGEFVGEAEPSTSDGTLLERFRKGSDDAATALYLRYANRLQRLADAKTHRGRHLAFDTEGIVQSVFRTFFRRIERGQYSVEDSESLWKLLLVIAMNKIRARAKYHSASKRNEQRKVSMDVSMSTPEGSDGRNADALRVLQMTIDELLAQHPEEVRDIIRFRIDGFQVVEIAEKTNRSKRTVERVLQKFRDTLNNAMIDD